MWSIVNLFFEGLRIYTQAYKAGHWTLDIAIAVISCFSKSVFMLIYEPYAHQ